MSKPGLECRQLGLFRKGPDRTPRAILNHVNAWFPCGRIALVQGSIGAGKTTLLHVLAGLLRPTQGEVLAHGQPISRWISAHRDVWRRQVGLVLQAPHVLFGLSVLENLILPLVPRASRLSNLRGKALDCLEALGASHLAGQDVRTLSAGELQQVAVARALVVRPAYLLADEPTAHQDDQAMQRIMQNLVSAARQGSTVVVAAHDPRVDQADWMDERYRLSNGTLLKDRSCGIQS